MPLTSEAIWLSTCCCDCDSTVFWATSSALTIKAEGNMTQISSSRKIRRAACRNCCEGINRRELTRPPLEEIPNLILLKTPLDAKSCSGDLAAVRNPATRQKFHHAPVTFSK